MSVGVLGIGTAVPTGTMTQVEAADLVGAFGGETERRKGVRALFRRAGVERRNSVLARENGLSWFYEPQGSPGATIEARMSVYRDHAGTLAARACVRALAQAEVAAGSIAHVVTVSCTGFAAPGVDLFLMDQLGLRADVTRTNIGFMGCHAAVNALRVAKGLAHEGGRVLVCCVELCTLHLCGGGGEGRVPSALFGDGAAAVVVGEPGDGGRAIRSTASIVVPGTNDLMSWHVGDYGFAMHLSPRVPEVLAEFVPGWVDSWLGTLGLTRGSVGAWAIHPGGPRVLGTLGRSLRLDEQSLDASREVLRLHGNMSSGTMLFIIDALMRDGARGPIVGLAFGPGLGGEGVVID
jgi:predicted naringenin-chalcone synthase